MLSLRFVAWMLCVGAIIAGAGTVLGQTYPRAESS
jgi:hypothetical protein